jgi:nucleoid DNA-binding protein
MRASIRGRDELADRVQAALSLRTKKEAEYVVNAVITSLETTLLNHLGADGFTLKLNGFGKFFVRHRPGILRKIGFTVRRFRRRRCGRLGSSVWGRFVRGNGLMDN